MGRFERGLAKVQQPEPTVVACFGGFTHDGPVNMDCAHLCVCPNCDGHGCGLDLDELVKAQADLAGVLAVGQVAQLCADHPIEAEPTERRCARCGWGFVGIDTHECRFSDERLTALTLNELAAMDGLA